MIRKEFCDINDLKKIIASGFHPARPSKSKPGWPTIIINVATNKAYRPDVKGPFSLFMNMKGNSVCRVNDHSALIEQGNFFLTNQDQHYTLEIDSDNPIESLNIHFGKEFTDDFFQGITDSHDNLIDRNGETSFGFYNRIRREDPVMKQLMTNFYRECIQQQGDMISKDIHLSGIMQHLMALNHADQISRDNLSAAKFSTREELYKRLNIGIDYLQSYYYEDVNLEEIALAAGLSKFHFLRLFKEVYQTTPHKYLNQIRVDRAKQLLHSTRNSVADISAQVGFINPSSFNRVFAKDIGVSPSVYRTAV